MKAESKRSRRLWGWLLAAIAIAALAMAVNGSLGGLVDRLTGPKGPDPKQALKALTARVAELEQACRAGDVDAVLELTHPAMQPSYRPILMTHQTELGRLADLLATRKLVALVGGVAEYEVTENGRTFYVTFEAVGKQWYLASL